jgi:hypothetical protein
MLVYGGFLLTYQQTRQLAERVLDESTIESIKKKQRDPNDNFLFTYAVKHHILDRYRKMFLARVSWPRGTKARKGVAMMMLVTRTEEMDIGLDAQSLTSYVPMKAGHGSLKVEKWLADAGVVTPFVAIPDPELKIRINQLI